MSVASGRSPGAGRRLAQPAAETLLAATLAVGVLVPVLSLMVFAAGADPGHWAGLLAHVLPQALRNTALLLAGVGVLVLFIGAGCAWLVASYDFPGRGVLQWALLLPLAMPTYIVAYAYLDLLHPIGPVQGLLRALLGYDSPRQWRLPDLRSLGGAVVLLACVLYPYVYLTARAMFATQSRALLEAARVLGESPWGAFRRVALPLARPALAVGLSLALLEVLNDIGASEFLGVNTLTVAIYSTWVTRSDLGGAAQLACAMLGLVLLLILLERHGRRHQRHGTVRNQAAIRPRRLHGARAWLASSATALPVLLGFVVPALHLLWVGAKRVREQQEQGQGQILSEALIASLGNTLGVAAGVTVITVGVGLVIAWGCRASTAGQPSWRWPARVASLGYAVPGTVLAIGLLPPALALDAWLAGGLGLKGLPLMSIGAILVAACVMRFLAISVGGTEAGLARLAPGLEQAARLLGERPSGVLRRVHLPLLRPALVTGAMLVFVDAMKELPATLLLRPANFETLATRLYAEAARGTYEDGALAALGIVGAGLLPVMWLARRPLQVDGDEPRAAEVGRQGEADDGILTPAGRTPGADR